MTLSKSQYIRGRQCHKSLWLLKNRPELRTLPDDEQESLFNTGTSIGELARELFPGGVEIVFDADNFNGMIEKTKELVASDTEIIYEATFSEDGIFAMADILVGNGDAWDMYEVKGSTRARDDKGVVKKHYLQDASIQWYALSKRIQLNKVYIVHIDNSYTRNGELEIEKLFAFDEITSEVKEELGNIEVELEKMEQALIGDMPDIDIGSHCDSPYHCDFSEYCWKHIPKENSVFDLSYAMGKQWQLYEMGILDIKDIPEDFPLGANASMQVMHHKTQEIKIDTEAIKAFLDTIEFPINFFDFETFQNAIPRFYNQRPYQQMPFQYSLHILYENGTMEHREFLGDENRDPRDELIEQMLDDITPTGSIVAYHDSFERTRIKELAEFKSDRAGGLLALNERFVDLIVSFRNKDYYHPNFQGRSSIKVVLPALFPNDPELDYKKLGSVQNGGDAMETFANLYLLKNKKKRGEIRNDLLAYCHLDTLAMVKIWEKLRCEVLNS